MNIQIQTSDAISSPQILNLMATLGYSLSETELTRNISEIRLRGGEVFVAKSDGRVVGCVCAIIDARLAAGIHGEIVSLVVAKEHRGKGIGRDLVEHAEGWLKKSTNKIRVRANEIRSGAHRFYQRLGYQDLKTQKIFIKQF